MSATVCDQKFFATDHQGVLCTNNLKFLNNSINVYSTKYQSKNMQRSNRTELCDATRNKKQSGFETHLGSDATFPPTKCALGEHFPRENGCNTAEMLLIETNSCTN